MNKAEMRESRSLKKGMASAMMKAMMDIDRRRAIQTAQPSGVLMYLCLEFSKIRPWIYRATTQPLILPEMKTTGRAMPKPIRWSTPGALSKAGESTLLPTKA